MLEIGADDALRLQTKAVTVEPDRPLQIIDAESEKSDSRFHRGTLTGWSQRLPDGSRSPAFAPRRPGLCRAETDLMTVRF